MAAKYGVSSQNISRTDVLCEGPVRGLKNGESSVFFNDVASEDAKVRGYNPIEGTSGGKLTFNGSSPTNTAIVGASIPIDLDLGDRRPRPLDLKDYKKTNVTLSNVTGTSGTGSVTCTAASGTPFSDGAWDTQGDNLRTAYLKRDGVLLKGEFFKTSTSAGTFVFNGVTDVIDVNETHELRISYRFFIQSITSSSVITLRATPAAGTYFFEIPPSQLGAGNAAARDRYRASKINGIQVEFRPGHRYQDPLNEIGGVGGAVSATQSANHELKVIGTGEMTGISPVPEDGTIGSTMESGLPNDSQDDVATAATVLNDTAFGITAAQRPEVDEISLRITYPGGLQSMNNNQGRRDPAYARYLIQIQTTLDGVDSAWENAFPREGAYVEHTGRTNAAYSFDHILGVNQYRPFDSFKVRVVRLTRHIGLRVNATGHGDGVTDKEKWTLIAKSKIDQLGYVIKDRLSYPYTSLISTSFSSKQYQEPPKMSYLMQGLKVKVPSTYTPREYSTQTDSNGNPIAVYDQFWDGTFKNELQYTDNPAWVFYDIVTNNRYGAGKWIQESDIDKYSLYRIARYCDELVDNGAGGTEPRFRSNIFLTKATDVYKVLKDFASTFTGMLYWMDGQLTPVQDSPSDPVYNFTKGNVIDGKFGYESSGTKTRSNQVIVTWNDPAANYEPVPLIVEDREAIVRDKKIITEEVVAFGCTSEAQAIRYGRWKLWTAQKQTEVVSFKSALNSLYIKPGDVINVQDADREGVQYSGRLASGTSTAAVLDRSVTLNAGSTYTISTLVTEAAAFYVGVSDITINSNTYSRGDRLPEAFLYDTVNNDGTYDLGALDTEEKASNAFVDASGTSLLPIVWKEYSYVQENAVTTSAGTTNTIDVAGFGTTPVANTIWALRESKDGLDVVGSYKKYRVLSINQDKSNEYGFSAVEHYDEKYGAVDSGYETGVIPTTVYVEAEPRDGETEMSAPTSPRVILESDPDKPGEEIKVEWEPSTSDFVQAYEIRHNIPDIENPLRTSDTFLRLTGITSDRLSFEIRAVSTGGNFSPYARVSYTFLDVYEEAIPRVAQGIPRGAFSSAQLIVTALNTIQFQAANAQVSPPSDPETIYTLTGSTNIANISADEDYLVYFDASGPSLQILYYDTTSLSSSFYYDVGTGNSAVSTSWTSIGNISIPANSNTVTGSGFLNSVVVGDVLNLAGTTSPTGLADGAVVVDVVSNTELVIDKVFDTAKSSLTAYRANFRPDYSNDTILAKIRKTGSTIKLHSFLTLRTIVDGVTLTTGDDGTTEVPDGAITVDKLAANSITADKIQANTINAREINADAINANHIVAGEITADAIAANAITADKVTANSVVASLLTASTIQSSHIKSNSIVATIIDATTINASDITTSTLSALTANMGDITAGTLKGGTIPDANASPSGTESGAFMDLTGGKMVFGNASKHVLFDGSNLVLSGVTIDANSIVNTSATPELIVQEDGSNKATAADTLNFTTGIDVSVSGNTATISANNQTPSWVPSTNPNYLTGITTTQVRNAGALMDDEVTDLVGVKGVTISSLQPKPSEGAFVNGDKTKLDNIDAGADVTPSWVPSTNPNYLTGITTLQVRNAGALMDDELTDLAGVKGVTISTLQPKPSEGAFVDGDKTKLNNIDANANNYSLPTASSIVLGGVKIGSGININSGTISAATQSDENFTSAFKTKLTNIEANANNYSLPTASSSTLGGVKIGAGMNIDANGAITASTQSDENFTSALKTKLTNIETNANNYSLPIGTTTVLGGVKDGARVTIDVNGVLSADVQTANDFTNALKNKLDNIAENANAYSLPTASAVVLGGVKIGSGISISSGTISADTQSDQNFTSTLKTKLDNIEANATADQSASEIRTLVNAATDSNVFTDNEQTKLAGIATNANNYSLPAATSTSLGGIQVGYSENGKNYPVELSSNNAYVNVPWENTQYSQATSSTLGLVKIGYTENAKNYPVELSSGQMFVNVPWTDNNTTYTAGSGLSLSGANQFSVDSTVVRTTGTQTIGGNKTFSNNIIVSGNLTVSGTTTYINTQTLNIGDNIITLNADFTGSTPTESAGIEVERGTQANALFQYKESGVGITGDLAAGWSVGTSRLEATGFYGTFYGDASNLSNINADSLSGLSTADLAEDPSATTTSGTMYYTDTRVIAALSGGSGIDKSAGGEFAVDSTVIRTTGAQTLAGTKTFSNGIVASGGISGLTLTNGISGTNFNITGVNQISINDPGEGILFTAGSSGNMLLAIVDDASDNILRYSGANAVFDVQGNITLSGTVDGRDLATDGAKLDNIAANANNYSLPTNNVTNASVSGNTLTLSRQGATNITFTDTNTTYSVGDGGLTQKNFTTTLKDKLDNIAANATNTAAPAISTNGSTPSLASGITAAEVRSLIGAGTSSLTLGTTSTTALRGDTAIPTVYNPAITLSAGNAGITMDSDNSFTLNQSGAETITISHADTSSQASVNNSSGTVIQDITLDTFGHITAINSTDLDGRYFTETESDARYLRKDSYNSNWTRLGYGTSGTAYWHKLAEVTINGSYKDYQLRCDWTDRYNHGTLNIHIHSDNDTTADIWDAYVQQFGQTNRKLSSHFKYYKSGSTVQVWIYTPGWREWDYIRTDAVTEGTPTIVWYKEGDSGVGKTTTEPSGLTEFSDYTPWHPNNDGPSSGLDADTLDGASPSMVAGNSTIVQRNASGYVFANFFNTTANDVSSGVTKIMVETGNDNYIRHGDAGAVRGFINVANGADVTPSWVPATNPNYLTGITSSQVTGALGFTPYNATNPNGYITGITSSQVTGALGFTPYNATNPSGYITNSGGTTASTANTVVKRDSAGDINARLFRSEYDTTNATIGFIMTQINTGTNNYIRPSTPAQVRSGLNVADGADVTPSWVPSTNPNYLTGITSSQVTGALGFTPYNATNPNGYITGISSSDVTTALGFTPYNATNPSGYITNSGGTTAATANTVAKRNGSADIRARLFRSNYANQATISGAMAFRVNNGTDDYIRFCSDAAAIRTFIGAGTSSTTGTVTSVSGGTGLSGTVTTSGSLNLTNTGVSAATYGNSTNIPQIAVDAQGRITSASNVAVSIPSSANNATITLTAGNGLTTGGSFTTDQSSNDTITFNVGAGDGISVAADTVAVDSTVLRAGTGTLINDIINANVITADMIQANSIVATIITAEEITASHIATNTITANEIAAGAITASELQISNNASGSAGIFMDYNSGNSRIDIRDATALRVRIGYLA